MHHNNEQFTAQCTDVPVGGTRNDIQKKLMQRLEEKRAVNAAERDVAVEQHINLQSRLKVQEAMARESILSSRKKRESVTVKNQKSKLKILQANRELFVKNHGEQAYEDKVNDLLTALLEAGNKDDPDVISERQNNNDNDMLDGSMPF